MECAQAAIKSIAKVESTEHPQPSLFDHGQIFSTFGCNFRATARLGAILPAVVVK
jgi:hypothetical protein